MTNLSVIMGFCMRIAIFTESFKPTINGAVVVIEKLKKYLTEMGHEAFVFTSGKVDKESRVYSCPKLSIQQGYGVSFPFFREAERKTLGKVDIFHVHHPFVLGLFALYLARRRNIPLVATVHTKYDNAITYTLKMGKNSYLDCRTLRFLVF